MTDNQEKTFDLQKAKTELQTLRNILTPDLQLLEGLQEEITKTIKAGATIKQIWESLRKAGFTGNQMKVSNWLEEKGIRSKIEKKGYGKRSKNNLELEFNDDTNCGSNEPDRVINNSTPKNNNPKSLDDMFSSSKTPFTLDDLDK